MSSMPSSPSTPRWHYPALLGVLVLAVGLHFFALDQEGYANLYYAAAVKSMLQNWHNFFFVAFDPGGFVTVDKPPLGLWVQTWSAAVFGFSGWAVLFPQALAGVLAVGLLYGLVRRTFGPTAGLVAALVLTLSPISIAANRNNTMDSQLVLTSLLATWAVVWATEKGNGWWLALGAALVGVGFNIKMLQAVMVLPAFYLLYLVAARTGWGQRLLHLGLATGVLAVVSLAWPLVVDATPKEAHPFIGSSTNNTVMELIVGHNGLSRLGEIAGLFGLSGGPGSRNAPNQSNTPPVPIGQGNANQPPPPNGTPFPQGTFIPQRTPFPPQGTPLPNGGPYGPPNGPPNNGGGPGGVQGETGEAGVLRLFNAQLIGQASWLLPLALLCAVALFLRAGGLWPLKPEQQAVVLWGAWLVPQMVFFSFAGLFHRYYLEMMVPAIAALVGAGVVALWEDYGAGHWRGWLLALGVAGSGVVAGYTVWVAGQDWRVWALPLVSLAAVVAGGGLVAGLMTPKLKGAWLAMASLVALLLGPAAWSLTPILGRDTSLPFAGPELVTRQAPGRQQALAVTQLVAYLQAQRQGEKFLVATLNANSAAPIILTTGEPVMALGGFSGSDNILTEAQLQAKVAAGEVRFFLVPQPGQGQNNLPPPPNAGNLQPPPPDGYGYYPYYPPNGNGPNLPPNRNQSPLTQWVSANCVAVPNNLWQEAGGQQNFNGPGGPTQLFDCRK